MSADKLVLNVVILNSNFNIISVYNRTKLNHIFIGITDAFKKIHKLDIPVNEPLVMIFIFIICHDKTNNMIKSLEVRVSAIFGETHKIVCLFV